MMFYAYDLISLQTVNILLTPLKELHLTCSLCSYPVFGKKRAALNAHGNLCIQQLERCTSWCLT